MVLHYIFLILGSGLVTTNPQACQISSPISVAAFSDGSKHYQNQTNNKDYPRYSVEQYELIAENILVYQRSNGGWPPNWDPLRILSVYEKDQFVSDRNKTDTSFDNRTTYPQIEYLVEVYNRTNKDIFLQAALRGLEFIFTAQYENGGWPHSFPSTKAYHPHITIMDDVMVGILTTLRKASLGVSPFTCLDVEHRTKAMEALKKGEGCLLNLQVKVDNIPTVWAGQYDRYTLEPTTGRSFELPGLVSAESVQVVRYFMEMGKPTSNVIQSIEYAIAWFERSALRGIRLERFSIAPVRFDHHTAVSDVRVVEDPSAPLLWARFYEI